MRRFIELGLLLTAFGAQAFDSQAWLAKHGRMTAEALRLREAYSNCAARVTTPADEVTVPIESFDDGSVKTIVHAKRAQYFLDSGLVWAEDVTVRKFKRDGSQDAMITTGHCLVDRVSKCGWAEGPSTVVHGKTTFTGNGVFFSATDWYVKVLQDSRVVSKDLKLGGMKP